MNRSRATFSARTRKTNGYLDHTAIEGLVPFAAFSRFLGPFRT